MEDLIITRHKDQLYSGLFDQQRLMEVQVAKEQEQSRLGNIYIAKVQNIVHNIESAFVEYEKGQMAYLSLKDCSQELVEPLMVSVTPGKKWKVRIGDELVIQIEKDAIKTKLPMATCRLNLAGRYAVLVHGRGLHSISSKIKDKKRKEALRALANEVADAKEVPFHFILRTNAEHLEDEKLVEELRELIDEYHQLLAQAKHRVVFSSLKSAMPEYLRLIKDRKEGSLSSVLTDDALIYQQVKEYLTRYQPSDLEKLRFYEDTNLSLWALYGMETAIGRALNKHVWLKSGAYLVIEPTEALTVVDVNTGKAIQGKRPKSETIRKINLEAAVETARQLRLRNLSGIILIDFIDMNLQEHEGELIQVLKQEIEKDCVKTSFVDVTGLFLVELTRKRTRMPLHECVKISDFS